MVSWNFLYLMLEERGFGPYFIKTIKTLYKNVIAIKYRAIVMKLLEYLEELDKDAPFPLYCLPWLLNPWK